jgi:mRNA-degrading endonuclease RelE of RelBE toxin-antitoxin system
MNENLESSYKSLKDGDEQEKRLYKWIKRAIEDLSENGFCGASIPKDRIPKKYLKLIEGYSLWKYDLPSGYRIIYVLENDEVRIYSIILEWFDHKNYERTFKY